MTISMIPFTSDPYKPKPIIAPCINLSSLIIPVNECPASCNHPHCPPNIPYNIAPHTITIYSICCQATYKYNLNYSPII